MIDFDLLTKDPLSHPPLYERVFLGYDNADISTTEIVGKPRVYHTPGGSFPSVTSVLGATSDKSWLEEWKEKIGREKAEGIAERSRARGSTMHETLEASIRRENYLSVAQDDFEALEMAKSIAHEVYPIIDTVFGLELPLWSSRLKIAGRMDCAAYINGVPTIVDFKNARRLKKADEIHGYFMQTSLYAAMLLERCEIWCPDIVIVVAQGDDRLGTVQTFNVKTDEWLGPAINEVHKYYKDH